MRILHLLDSAGPQACATTLALLSDSFGRLASHEQSLLLLGGTSLLRSAESVGLKRDRTARVQIVGVPHGQAVLGYTSARQRLRSVGPIDLVHCWSLGSLTLASMLLWREKVRRVLTLTTEPDARSLRWLRALLSVSGTVTILCTSATIRHALISNGVPESLVRTLRPSIDLSRVAHAQRQALRERWKLPHENTMVIAPLNDPAPAGDATLALWPAGLAAQTLADGYDRIRLLLHPRQANRLRARRTQRGMGRESFIIEDAGLDEPWTVLPGCDVATACGPSSAGLSVLWAMASNVPIVGEATYAMSEVLEDRHSALLSKPGQPKLVAHRIRQLIDDPSLAYKLRDTARREAFSYFSRQRYCEELDGVYKSLVSDG
jgi:hypothetical protein